MSTVYSDAYQQDEAAETHIDRSAGLTHNGEAKISHLTASVTADLGAADVIKFRGVPKGARVSRLVITNTDLDTGTAAITCDVGFKSAASQFGNDLTILQGAATTTVTDAVLAAAAAAGDDDDLRITIGTAANTAAAGTITVLAELFIP